MVNLVKLIGTPHKEFSYLNKNSDNKQVLNLVDKLSKGIEFKSGLNYLIGENGSGKSTLLNIIKAVNRCQHSFIPKVDTLRLTTVTRMSQVLTSIEVKQDYCLPVFNLYRQKEDTDRHNNLRDKDEFRVHMAGLKESKGQNLMGDINTLFNWMFKRTSECYPVLKLIKDLHNSGTFKEPSNLLSENDTSTKLMDRIKANQVSCEDTNPIYTILMDEPDQGLDINNLIEVYEVISYDKPNTQLIAAINNPLLIYKLSKSTNANWIEITDGYLDKVVNQFMKL